jgi:hypothetical protein
METPHTDTTVSRDPTFRCLPTTSLLIVVFEISIVGGCYGVTFHTMERDIKLSIKERISSLFGTLCLVCVYYECCLLLIDKARAQDKTYI